MKKRLQKTVKMLCFASSMVFITTSYNNCGKLIGADSEVKFSYLSEHTVFQDEVRDLDSGATWLDGESFDEGMDQFNQMDDGDQGDTTDDGSQQANNTDDGIDKFDQDDDGNDGITIPTPTAPGVLNNGGAPGGVARMRNCIQSNGDPGFQFLRKNGVSYSSCDICEVIDRVNGRCLIRVKLPDPPPSAVAANGNSFRPDGDDRRSDPLIIDVWPAVAKTGGAEISQLKLSSPENGLGFDVFGQRGKVPYKKFQISWTDNPRYMYLALPNSHGQILGIDQLFGDSTRGPDGRYALDGFQALSKYDGMDGRGLRRLSHPDGVINKSDAIFSRLRLWADTNFSGTAEADEIKTLDEVGIVSIDLVYDSNFYEKDVYGNEAIFKSVAEFANGDMGIVFDLWFAVDPQLPVDNGYQKGQPRGLASK